ncbi:MAG: PspA/IM30 family protein [Bacteroidota bacterium]
MGIFKRLFKVGEAEAHAVIDKLENPIKLTEQGIRDLKKDLDKSLQSLAEVKAMAIRSKNEMISNKNQADNYEQKAIQLLKKAEASELDPSEADRLATEALNKKEQAMQQSSRAKEDKDRFDVSIAQLEQNVKNLRSNVSKWENELRTLKARDKVNTATKNLNKQLANIDSSSTVSMLEKMKNKVEQDEALAQSYGEIANESRSVDDEIDKALSTPSSNSDALAALKAKMNQSKG